MAITITAPKPAASAAAALHRKRTRPDDVSSDSDSDAGGGADLEGDISMMAPTKRRSAVMGAGGFDEIVTPGEEITSDPQWMRGHGTHLSPTTGSITASLAGTLTRTNKLLTVRPLHARYAPEIGDLVVGRVVEVQSRRWRVDVGAAHLATLQLSAINLPGGVLRRRTDTDELQIRAFFAEGDALVAEVQQLHSASGEASLHARSLRYGKLRNGIFVAVKARGGTGGGVVRARRHVWTMHGRGTTAVDVVLGVNGYVWVCKHVEGGVAGSSSSDASGSGGAMAGLSRAEESVNAAAYSSQNEGIDAATMREVARVRSVIVALAENGVRVDEEMVRKAYAEALEMGVDQDHEDTFFGGERGRQLIKALAL